MYHQCCRMEWNWQHSPPGQLNCSIGQVYQRTVPEEIYLKRQIIVYSDESSSHPFIIMDLGVNVVWCLRLALITCRHIYDHPVLPDLISSSGYDPSGVGMTSSIWAMPLFRSQN